MRRILPEPFTFLMFVCAMAAVVFILSGDLLPAAGLIAASTVFSLLAIRRYRAWHPVVMQGPVDPRADALTRRRILQMFVRDALLVTAVCFPVVLLALKAIERDGHPVLHALVITVVGGVLFPAIAVFAVFTHARRRRSAQRGGQDEVPQDPPP